MTMITQEYKTRVKSLYKKSDIIFTPEEIDQIEYADFGLNNIENEGLNLIIYVNTDRYCAKEMVLLPNQACPEHRHPDLSKAKGKQETFRCRWGQVFLYVEGEDKGISTSLPQGENQPYYTVRKEIILMPGQQYTIDPNIKHWFKAGSEGAVISEFSSTSYDEFDIFTNPNIRREAQDKITN
ncbi:D-lyxose/D-mannose family sugar isomerase [Gilliamella sp. wkB108]|uniref:D-lyxose/D-mannose family sugar isomerase n=1 Tax=Gilliamella sp. wkB108 TaxID=3120256 RepID=UPI00080E3795|nr:D-lyxose/D-mannose family sugar isomerase [Gilliamella apicola]OCG20932.1 D-lyxose/D-mannose family sugar isomerase [Gilliamella apicola]